MSRNKIIAVSVGSGLSVMLLLALYAGPDARYTGAPGDNPTACIYSGCHVGTLNSGIGSLAVAFQNGPTYVPGVPQTFTVTITDQAAQLYGFEMTARLESDPENGQAGDFTAGAGQGVLCAGAFGDPGIPKTGNGCPSSHPVEFIEHAGKPFSTGIINVLWTPPQTNVGNVHIYIAANAAPSTNGSTPNTHDHIYMRDYVLTPACTDATPTITNVQSAGGFNANAGLASGTWLEIYGTNLTCSSARGWAGSDFNGNNAPTSLNNVKVTVDGIPAYVEYINPGQGNIQAQVNVQAPDDPNTGDVIPIVLTNSAGSSNTFSMHKSAIAPALLAPSSFDVQGHQWVVAQHVDQTYVGKSGLISGVTFSPAKPGETIVIYGIGFGPVNPAVAAGTITPATPQNSLVTTPTFRFGQTPASVQFDGLVGGYVGLYQFNVKIPNVSAGDMPLNVDVGGVPLNQNLYITVGQ